MNHEDDENDSTPISPSIPDSDEDHTITDEACSSDISDSREQIAQRDTEEGLPKKSAKRVSFKDDDILVEVLEIPCRGQSPMSEEMEPCDPEKLAEEIAAVRIESSGGDGSSCAQVKTSHARQESTKSTPPKTTASHGSSHQSTRIKSPAQRSHTRQTVKLSLNKKDNNSTTQRPSTAPPSSNKTKRLQVNKQSLYPDELSVKLRIGTISPVNQRPSSSRHSSNKTERAPRKIKSASLQNYRSRMKSNQCSLTSISISDSLKSRVYSKAAGVSVEGRNFGAHFPVCGRGSQMDRINQPFPLIRHSSYRASSAGATRSPIITQPAIVNDCAQHQDLSGIPGRITGTDSRTPPFNKKFYAWQMANGVIKNPQMETPCISPLWEVPTNRLTHGSFQSLS